MDTAKRTLKALKKWGIEARPLRGQKGNSWIRRWKRTFLVPVSRKIAKESLYGQFFHTFSFKLTPAVEGDAARQKYRNATDKDIVVFFWEGFPSFQVIECHVKKPMSVRRLEFLRDLQQSFADIHVTGSGLDWTFCVTHEPDCGPYFSKPPKNWRARLTERSIRKKLGPKMLGYLNE